MANVVDWISFYPHPDVSQDVYIRSPYSGSGRIGDLWKLAKEEEPSLANHIGKAKCTFLHRTFIVLVHMRFFLYLL
jgi:hypothetical protein